MSRVEIARRHQKSSLWFICWILWRKTLSNARHAPRGRYLPTEDYSYYFEQSFHVASWGPLHHLSSLGLQKLLWASMSPQIRGEQFSIDVSCDPDTKGVPERQLALPHGEPQRLTNWAPYGSWSCPQYFPFIASPSWALSIHHSLTQLLTQTPSWLFLFSYSALSFLRQAESQESLKLL